MHACVRVCVCACTIAAHLHWPCYLTLHVLLLNLKVPAPLPNPAKRSALYAGATHCVLSSGVKRTGTMLASAGRLAGSASGCHARLLQAQINLLAPPSVLHACVSAQAWNDVGCSERGLPASHTTQATVPSQPTPPVLAKSNEVGGVHKGTRAHTPGSARGERD